MPSTITHYYHYKDVYNKLSKVEPTEDYKLLFAYSTALADLLSV